MRRRYRSTLSHIRLSFAAWLLAALGALTSALMTVAPLAIPVAVLAGCAAVTNPTPAVLAIETEATELLLAAKTFYRSTLTEAGAAHARGEMTDAQLDELIAAGWKVHPFIVGAEQALDTYFASISRDPVELVLAIDRLRRAYNAYRQEIGRGNGGGGS